MISGNSAEACWRQLTRQLGDYWARLSQAGTAHGFRGAQPVLRRGSNAKSAEIVLGGDLIRNHVPMATQANTEDLFDAAEGKHEGVFLGAPPFAVLLALEHLTAVEIRQSEWRLRTDWYKHCLLVLPGQAPTARTAPDQPPSFALRVESDGRVGWNSWLLNHPVHHAHFAAFEPLRIGVPAGRSILAQVDSALRFFAEDAWSALYPALYAGLTSKTGALAPFTANAQQHAPLVDAAHAEKLEKCLKEGVAASEDWALELAQWRSDTACYAEEVPELFDYLAGRLPDAAVGIGQRST